MVDLRVSATRFPPLRQYLHIYDMRYASYSLLNLISLTIPLSSFATSFGGSLVGSFLGSRHGSFDADTPARFGTIVKHTSGYTRPVAGP